MIRSGSLNSRPVARWKAIWLPGSTWQVTVSVPVVVLIVPLVVTSSIRCRDVAQAD